MTPARSFARLWLLFTLLTLAYAACDLALNPWLRFEVGFSMKPDFTRLPELMHWGGRLYMNGAWWLLICNAVLLGGMGALGALTLWAVYRTLCSTISPGSMASPRSQTSPGPKGPETERPSVRISHIA